MPWVKVTQTDTHRHKPLTSEQSIYYIENVDQVEYSTQNNDRVAETVT